VLRPLIGALAAGAIVLAPSLYYLMRVFKGDPKGPSLHSG